VTPLLYALLSALLAVPTVALLCRGSVALLAALKRRQRPTPPGHRPEEESLPLRPGIGHPDDSDDDPPRLTGQKL